MNEVPRKNRFDGEYSEFQQIYNLLNEPERSAYSFFGLSKQLAQTIYTSILDKESWGDLTAPSTNRPDFYSSKHSIMMEFMNIDCETIHEDGTIDPVNSKEIGSNMRAVGKSGLIENNADVTVFTTPSVDYSGKKDSYTNYINGAKRVISKHIDNIPEYHTNHPNSTLGFVFIDFTLPYMVCKSKEDVVRFNSGEEVHVELHHWCRDEAIINLLKDKDIDFVIWYTPYKIKDYNIINPEWPQLCIFNPRLVETVSYDPELVVCDPSGDGKITSLNEKQP